MLVFLLWCKKYCILEMNLNSCQTLNFAPSISCDPCCYNSVLVLFFFVAVYFQVLIILIIYSIGNIHLCPKKHKFFTKNRNYVLLNPKVNLFFLIFFRETLVQTVGIASSDSGVYFQSVFLTNSRRQSLIDTCSL